MPTRLRTVVFTDLANYTASVGRSDRSMLRQLLSDHEQQVLPPLARNGGHVVKNLGDSFMVLFESATDAVRAALELINMRAAGGLNLRVAMATGDVEVIDGDAFGENVNLASRILSRTPEGEVWFSHSTLLCMNQSEIPWEPVGRLGGLKGITGEVEVFRAVPPDRVFLPELVREAAMGQRLVRLGRGAAIPALPDGAVVLLEGFRAGSDELDGVVDRMPAIPPSHIWALWYNVAPSDRHQWLSQGHGVIVGQTAALSRALAGTVPARQSTSDTMIIDLNGVSVMDLVVGGLALPLVPMSEVVSSYTYDLLSDGRWVNRSEQAVARVEVTNGAVRLEALKPGLLYRGRQLPTGEVVELANGDMVIGPSGPVQFVAVHNESYQGLLLADSNIRVGVAPGQRTELGREPGLPGLALLDRRGQENIRWCPGPRAARARAGGFTLDRALAGRRQCAVEHAELGLALVSIHDRCKTWVLEAGQLVNVADRHPVDEGALIVAGTTVVALRAPEG